jgi:hypothetical protein
MSHDAAVINPLDRLAILREAAARILALGPALDRLAQVATKLLQAPIAYIVLGDAKQQTILSAIGVPERLPEPTALALASAILTPGARSPQPLPPDRAIAAFTGVRLLSAGGSMIGALCVADSAQRAWSAGDHASLADLASIVAQTIETHCDLLAQTEAAASARQTLASLELRLADEVGQREALAYALVEAQKRESFITLVGGIAHNFNNLLATILGNAELALLELPPDSPAHVSIVPITIAAQRAA